MAFGSRRCLWLGLLVLHAQQMLAVNGILTENINSTEISLPNEWEPGFQYHMERIGTGRLIPLPTLSMVSASLWAIAFYAYLDFNAVAPDKSFLGGNPPELQISAHTITDFRVRHALFGLALCTDTIWLNNRKGEYRCELSSKYRPYKYGSFDYTRYSPAISTTAGLVAASKPTAVDLPADTIVSQRASSGRTSPNKSYDAMNYTGWAELPNEDESIPGDPTNDWRTRITVRIGDWGEIYVLWELTYRVASEAIIDRASKPDSRGAGVAGYEYHGDTSYLSVGYYPRPELGAGRLPPYEAIVIGLAKIPHAMAYLRRYAGCNYVIFLDGKPIVDGHFGVAGPPSMGDSVG